MDILNICMKEFGLQKNIIDKMSYDNLDNSSGLYYKGVMIVLLLIENFDTLPTHCRHIEHMHEGVWFPKKYQ